MSKEEVDAWQLAKDMIAKKRVVAISMGLFQPGTLVSFCYQGQARIGVIHSVDPKQDAIGVAYINAKVAHLDNPSLLTEVRKEGDMCLILRNVFEQHKEYIEALKGKKDEAQ